MMHRLIAVFKESYVEMMTRQSYRKNVMIAVSLGLITKHQALAALAKKDNNVKKL